MLKDLLAYQCIKFLNYRLDFENEPNGSIIGHTWNLFSEHSLTYHMCFHRGPYGMDHILQSPYNMVHIEGLDSYRRILSGTSRILSFLDSIVEEILDRKVSTTSHNL